MSTVSHGRTSDGDRVGARGRRERRTTYFAGAVLAAGAAAMLLAAGVACRPARPELDTSRPTDFGFQTTPQEALVLEGKVAYERYCVGCHGVEGDGKGDAAGFLHPRPRNFQIANYKFSSTRSGQLPTDEDLRRSIRNGLKGSAMPAWNLLPDRTIDALIAYIKTFSPKWQAREPAAPIPRFEDPYRSQPDKTAAIQRGEAVYHGYATCWTCHPAYVSGERINEYFVLLGGPPRLGFRANLHLPEGKANNEGELIYPPDFTRDFVRSGVSVDDVYRTIAAGISGTAMPTWVDTMELPGLKEGDPPLVQPADLWAMSYYVQRLIQQRPQLLAMGSFEVRRRPVGIFLDGSLPPLPPPQGTATEPTGEGEPTEFFEEDQ